MFRENKNLKDLKKDSIKDKASMPTPYQAVGFVSSSYTKTNKLITALYMVTDIIDKDEPIRNKLRTLGIEIISDMNLLQQNNIGHVASLISDKISEIVSFLDLASTINIISEMNSSILRKEFLALSQSIKEATNKKTFNRAVNLSEFFKEEPQPQIKDNYQPIGRHQSTRIGVQKGSTLMKALNGIMMSNTKLNHTNADGFDVLKRQRRNNIINIIKIIGQGATIKDIKDKAETMPEQAGPLASCSEKTLQRELISMVKDGVLNKTGEKRWSKYQLQIRNS
jgi:hypothetical protein